MNISKFLGFNNHCPVCGEALSLYLQVSEGPLWKGKNIAPGVFDFTFLKGDQSLIEPESSIRLADRSETFDVYFSDNKVKDKFDKWSFFLYYMCNEDAIEDKPYGGWIINPYIACYVRSSPYVKFNLDNDKWELIRSKDNYEDDEDGSFALPISQTKNEVCIFKVQTGDLEKVYALDLDYQENKTVLRYYATTAKERSVEDFEPKTFKKELPMLSVRPNFSLTQRPDLISRLDSWILMS